MMSAAERQEVARLRPYRCSHCLSLVKMPGQQKEPFKLAPETIRYTIQQNQNGIRTHQTKPSEKKVRLLGDASKIERNQTRSLKWRTQSSRVDFNLMARTFLIGIILVGLPTTSRQQQQFVIRSQPSRQLNSHQQNLKRSSSQTGSGVDDFIISKLQQEPRVRTPNLQEQQQQPQHRRLTSNSYLQVNNRRQLGLPTPSELLALQSQPNSDGLEARGIRLSSLGSRGSSGSRNGSLESLESSSSWRFPRFSPEQAAEVLLTGAQVINRIAQAESPLNYCKTPDNLEGECSDIRKCIWLVLDKARLKQSVCLRNLIIPAVCCPLSQTNNTPIANMIQSTLEPVLFRPKQPKQKNPPQLVSNGGNLRPFASIVNKTIVGQPPPSPATMIIRATAISNASQTASTQKPTEQQQLLLASGSGSQPEAPVNSPSITQSSSPIALLATTTPFPVSPSSLQESSGYMTTNKSAPLFPNGSRYPWTNETCGEGSRTRTGRIVGGTDSKLGQWPWMTAMYLSKRPGAGEFWCGGALINRRFILTAAHCLSDQRGNRYKNDQVTIKLGGVDLVRHQAPLDILRNADPTSLEERAPATGLAFPSASSTSGSRQHQRSSASSRRVANMDTKFRSDEDEEFSWTSFITKALGFVTGSGPAASVSSNKALNTPESHENSVKQQLAAHAKRTYFKEYRVASIKQHPKFQRHGFYNDIGLIELKSDVDYDDLISPVCLPSENDLKRDLSGYMATVLGWGTLSYGGQGSKLLQQVTMPIWTNKDCDDRYLQHIGKTFLCAGFLTGGKDACQGDSGGPLIIGDRSGRWTLHGVVSFGKTCAQANYPGVYTRVTEYLDWIKDNTLESTWTGRGSPVAPAKGIEQAPAPPAA